MFGINNNLKLIWNIELGIVLMTNLPILVLNTCSCYEVK